MSRFWDLFKASVIVQALIALVLLVTICYMFATGQEVPGQLQNFFAIVLGFYFGSKVQTSIMRR